jgi:hypothetical protein
MGDENVLRIGEAAAWPPHVCNVDMIAALPERDCAVVDADHVFGAVVWQAVKRPLRDLAGKQLLELTLTFDRACRLRCDLSAGSEGGTC